MNYVLLKDKRSVYKAEKDLVACVGRGEYAVIEKLESNKLAVAEGNLLGQIMSDTME